MDERANQWCVVGLMTEAGRVLAPLDRPTKGGIEDAKRSITYTTLRHQVPQA